MQSTVQSTPYPERWREEDRFDGEKEGDLKFPDKRRLNVSSVAPFIDHHIRRNTTVVDALTSVSRLDRILPLTVAFISVGVHDYQFFPEEHYALIP